MPHSWHARQALHQGVKVIQDELSGSRTIGCDEARDLLEIDQRLRRQPVSS
jgi:hypothetical protein